MSNEVKPITPAEVLKEMEDSMPSFVFEVVNKLIKEKMFETGHKHCTIKQKDIVKALESHQDVPEGADVYKTGWLNFEPHYRKAGWRVKYDKPGWNENYDAYFEFSSK